jgi:hypothetical protein
MSILRDILGAIFGHVEKKVNSADQYLQRRKRIFVEKSHHWHPLFPPPVERG